MRALVSSALVLAALSATTSALAWTPKALPPLPGDESSQARDVNDRNLVAGESQRVDDQTEEETHTAVVWDEAGMPRALRTPDGFLSCEATAINNHGQVAGVCFDGRLDIAVRWSPKGVPTLLPPLDGDNTSGARDINDRGAVVGVSADADLGNAKATIWKGRRSRLLPDGHLKEASGINNRGVIISDGSPVAWPKSFRRPQPLAPTSNGVSGFAADINNRNWIVGLAPNPNRAILWQGLDSDPIELPWPTEPDLNGTIRAVGINDRGEIAGSAIIAGHGVAVFWDHDQVPTELPALPGDDTTSAMAIGARGIAGISINEDRVQADWRAVDARSSQRRCDGADPINLYPKGTQARRRALACPWPITVPLSHRLPCPPPLGGAAADQGVWA